MHTKHNRYKKKISLNLTINKFKDKEFDLQIQNQTFYILPMETEVIIGRETLEKYGITLTIPHKFVRTSTSQEQINNNNENSEKSHNQTTDKQTTEDKPQHNPSVETSAEGTRKFRRNS